MFNKTNHSQTYRSTPNRVKPVSPARIQELLEIERAKFNKLAPQSGIENQRASQVTPLGGCFQLPALGSISHLNCGR